ncbi:conserved hypothetical protein [uncultured Eubacteriales bacterium]|uniref:DUF3793 domain-containing protein n=1 Tax=uncultured Eubacteriales bacterium TaxID=172733 RepID=A0A212JDK9_9FIRM|nr:conserved hypothetical protein [uncultured Eubacteriales bacterium]
MPEELIIKFCAPTLAGIKTGNMFSCPCETKEALRADVRTFNRALVPKGLCLLPLRYSEGRALLYLFRPAELRRDLSHAEAALLLEDAGYRSIKAEHCIRELIRRLNIKDGFPHEIGLFLSYPPEDVRGFIDHNAGNCKCVGYWKVYGDVEKAQRLFEKYRKCTECYYRQWCKGISIERLLVAA